MMSGPEDDFLYGATKVCADADQREGSDVTGSTIGPIDECGLRCDVNVNGHYCNAPCVKPTNLAPWQPPHLHHVCGNHMPARRMPSCHMCGTSWPDRAPEALQKPFKCQCGTTLMSYFDPQASTGPNAICLRLKTSTRSRRTAGSSRRRTESGTMQTR